MKKFNSYKDSGISWIGEIPKHWNITKAKLCSDFRMGQTILKEDVNDEGDFPVYSATEGDHYFGRINNPSFILEPGDIVIPARGNSIGFVALVHELSVSTQTTIANFIDKSKMNSKYVFYFYKGFRHTLFHFNATAIPQITVDQVKQNPIICPPLNEQTSIANYLDQKTTQIDDLIAKKERLIKLIDEERTAIINQAVTKGLDPSVPMKDSGIEWLGEIPEHWEVTKIKTVTIKIGSGVTPKGGAEIYELSGIPLLRSQNIYFDGFRLENVAYITSEIHDSMKNSQVQSGDVLLNITGGSIGRCYYVTNEFEEANVNQHVCIVRPNERIITEFLYYVLSSTIGQQQIDLCQTGGNREALNFEQLKNFFLCLPKVDEQKNIVQRLKTSLNNINLTIEKFRKEIELINEYKTALISEVVTGKVDVRNWQPMNKN
jgi:type I restriction enzyme S subunit